MKISGRGRAHAIPLQKTKGPGGDTGAKAPLIQDMNRYPRPVVDSACGKLSGVGRLIAVDYRLSGQSNKLRQSGGGNELQGGGYGAIEIRKSPDDGGRRRQGRGWRRGCRLRVVRWNATPKRQLSAGRIA